MNSRFYQILDDISNYVSDAAQKTYKGKKRSELKDSDFLFPETRSFPIVSPRDIPDAISNFGRMKGEMSYDAFLKKLYNMAKRKGPEFVAALPKATKDRLGIDKKSMASSMFKVGDAVKNINAQCKHYGSEGVITDISDLPNDMGKVVTYKTINSGKTWSAGDSLTKTEVQLALMEPDYDTVMETPASDDETPEMELEKYKEDFLSMNIGSLMAIMNHAMSILEEIKTNPMVKENLTESWLQGKIAITEDYMRTIHDFVKYVPGEDDNSLAQSKPGLWENIRRKREKMGKNYKPAKPGDKDRPESEQWKRLTK